MCIFVLIISTKNLIYINEANTTNIKIKIYEKIS